MTTKEKIVQILEESGGHPVSGESMADALGVSRTAIWKAVKALEREGYKFEASSGTGYTLCADNDVVSEAGILKYLGTDCGIAEATDPATASAPEVATAPASAPETTPAPEPATAPASEPATVPAPETEMVLASEVETTLAPAPESANSALAPEVTSAAPAARELRFKVFDTVPSTNDVLKEAAAREELPEGTVYVAAHQEKGKGRRGRSFYSPKGTGIYFSLLLHPRIAPKDAGTITTMAACAVALALEKSGIEDVGIKWVNDVYIGNKKVSGILTEAISDLESGTVESAIVGIGLNIYTPEEGWPEEIQNRAASIIPPDEIMEIGTGKTYRTEKRNDLRNKLTAYTTHFLMDLYRNKTREQVTAIYKEKCFVPGRRITVIRNNEERAALALRLDEECHLVVRYDSGEEEVLASGEISLRLE